MFRGYFSLFVRVYVCSELFRVSWAFFVVRSCVRLFRTLPCFVGIFRCSFVRASVQNSSVFRGHFSLFVRACRCSELFRVSWAFFVVRSCVRLFRTLPCFVGIFRCSFVHTSVQNSSVVRGHFSLFVRACVCSELFRVSWAFFVVRSCVRLFRTLPCFVGIFRYSFVRTSVQNSSVIRGYFSLFVRVYFLPSLRPSARLVRPFQQEFVLVCSIVYSPGARTKVNKKIVREIVRIA